MFHKQNSLSYFNGCSLIVAWKNHYELLQFLFIEPATSPERIFKGDRKQLQLLAYLRGFLAHFAKKKTFKNLNLWIESIQINFLTGNDQFLSSGKPTTSKKTIVYVDKPFLKKKKTSKEKIQNTKWLPKSKITHGEARNKNTWIKKNKPGIHEVQVHHCVWKAAPSAHVCSGTLHPLRQAKQLTAELLGGKGGKAGQAKTSKSNTEAT